MVPCAIGCLGVASALGYFSIVVLYKILGHVGVGNFVLCDMKVKLLCERVGRGYDSSFTGRKRLGNDCTELKRFDVASLTLFIVLSLFRYLVHLFEAKHGGVAAQRTWQ